MNQNAKLNASTVAFAGALMLFWSWYSGSWTYPDFATVMFDWMLLVGGIAMIGVAVVCYLGARIGLLLETIVSGICGVIMLVCAGTWIVKGLMGINTVLIGIFGVMFVSAARSAWSMYQSDSGSGPHVAAQLAAPVAPPPPHPASQASPALPKDGEPPPEEGYLAALAKEEE